MSIVWIVVFVYLVVVIVLVAAQSALARHKRRFEMIFTYDVDYVFYETAKQLEQSKEKLVDYQWSAEVLYHDKKKLFSKPVATYMSYFPQIQENMDYLEDLLKKEIFTKEFRKRLMENYQTTQKISGISSFTHTILVFLTLWIAKLWG